VLVVVLIAPGRLGMTMVQRYRWFSVGYCAESGDVDGLATAELALAVENHMLESGFIDNVEAIGNPYVFILVELSTPNFVHKYAVSISKAEGWSYWSLKLKIGIWLPSQKKLSSKQWNPPLQYWV
ncbi:hypothetical protein M8C21_012050, partial [Ambrosia artemisiifolia]